MPKMITDADFNSALEAIASIGSSAILEPLSGYAGLLSLLRGRGLDDAVSAINSTQDHAYQPKDPRALEEFAKLMEPIGNAYMGTKEFLGDKTMDVTGSPTASTMAYNAPELIGGLLGVKQMMPKKVPGHGWSDNPDMGRRKFIKNAGIGAAGVSALPGAGLLGDAADFAAPAAKKADNVIRATQNMDPRVYEGLIEMISDPNFRKALYDKDTPDFKLDQFTEGPLSNLTPKQFDDAIEATYLFDEVDPPMPEIAHWANGSNRNVFDTNLEYDDVLDTDLLGQTIASGSFDLKSPLRPQIQRHLDESKDISDSARQIIQDAIDSDLSDSKLVMDNLRHIKDLEFKKFGERSSFTDAYGWDY